MSLVRRLLCVLLLAEGALAATGTHPKAAIAGPNVVLITLDTTRADRMGFLGSQRGLTPNLDALARQGVVFSRAYAHVPLTPPSHANILTGTYPQFNQMHLMGAALSKDLPYLPDILHRHGYHTGAFVGSMILDPKASTALGFDRGFDIYDAGFHAGTGEDRYQSVERRGGEVVYRALTWLAKHQTGPFFLWVHLFDAHDPYDPPEPYKTRYAAEPYDGEIAYEDSAVGKLLAELRARGRYDGALIAVMADHGEAFGEHGEQRHGIFLYDETIHVPLLFKLPGERSSKRVEARVGLVDVAPTILGETGIAVPAAIQGHSLLGMMKAGILKTRPNTDRAGDVGGVDVVADRPAYAESNYALRAFGWSALSAWRAGKYLYVQAPKRELYDQSVDSHAARNLAPDAKAVADTMAEQLEGFHSKTSSVATAQAELDPAQVENLRALGYMASGSGKAGPNGEDGGIDPKDKIEIANLMHEALTELALKDYDDAIPQLERVVRDEPNTAVAYLELGRAYFHLKQYQRALPMLQKAVEMMVDSSMAHYELGLALVKTGAWEAAGSEFEAAVARSPRSAELHFNLGAVYARLKRVTQATQEWETALKIDPDHYETNLRFGRMLFLERDFTAALPKLQRATKLKPNSPEAHFFLGDEYSQLGQEANARREQGEAERLQAAKP